MGLFDWIRKNKEKEKTEHPRLTELAQIGILVGRSDELEKRLKQREQFYEKLNAFQENLTDEKGKLLPPEKQIEAMLKGLDEIDRLLKQSSIPWGRAGSVDWYRQAMSGWEGLLAIAKSDVLVCLNILRREKSRYLDAWDLVNKLRSFLIVEVLRYAQYIEDVSFFEADITEKWSLVVQQPSTPTRGIGIDLNKEIETL